MKVKELCMVAVMAAIEMVVFTSFSFILYLEFITFTIVVFALVFSRKMAVLSSFVFGIVNIILIQGLTPWSMCYLILYPSYSLIVSTFKEYLLKHPWILCSMCGILSFLTGQILQLPFLLFSKVATLIYLIAGLKVSLIQGFLSFVSCMILWKPVTNVLKRIERG